MTRYWPLGKGRVVSSPWGPRASGFHKGVDFDYLPGGAGFRPVYAIDGGTVKFAGAADGYGGPDPFGWVVIEGDSGCWEYGHVRRRCNAGDRIEAGQIIAIVNNDRATNANVVPHLHLSYMPGRYDPNTKADPMSALKSAVDPTVGPFDPDRAPVVLGPITGGTVGDPIWLEDVLRPALGARLKTLPGWQDSGHGDFKDIRGVMVHHTGNSRETAESIRNGRPDLAGPLANLHIAPDGTVTIVAVGVCWHAGVGSYPWLPTNNANWHMIGIECAWPTVAANGSFNEHERWPDAQIIAMRDTCAALATKLGVDASHVIGHKEYAGAAQGKWDPGNIDMNWFRGEVTKDMRGEFDTKPPVVVPPPPPVLPPVLPPPANPRTDRQLLQEIWDQQRGPGGNGWPQLGDKSIVDFLSELGTKVDKLLERGA